MKVILISDSGAGAGAVSVSAMVLGLDGLADDGFVNPEGAGGEADGEVVLGMGCGRRVRCWVRQCRIGIFSETGLQSSPVHR